MPEELIERYPDSTEITIGLRTLLHPLFKGLKAGISEFTFANIYLFRLAHEYRISLLGGLPVISGRDKETFFMLPFGIPPPELLKRLFDDFSFMKNASSAQAGELSGSGYRVTEDRDNFDYLYSHEELVRLTGRKFHRKKNLVNAFLGRHRCEGKPLTRDRIKDALLILEEWRKASPVPGDYAAAREALEKTEELALCGGIYYVGDKPAAYALGEELGEDTFVVHFEKGVEGYKGLLQFVNQSFASILPEKYRYINREQDLGEEGLRKSKMSYKPVGFVKKFRVTKAS